MAEMEKELAEIRARQDSRSEFLYGKDIQFLLETIDRLMSELEQVKQERDAARKELEQFTAERSMAEIRENVIDAATVGPMVRMIYGDTAELGHYKLAITAFKKGKEGTILLIGQLGRAKIRAEASEAREARLREALEKIAATDFTTLQERIQIARAALKGESQPVIAKAEGKVEG